MKKPDTTIEAPVRLTCSAHECPYPWTVESADRDVHQLCRHHAWAPKEEWPRITHGLLLAIAAKAGQPEPEVVRFTQAQKTAAILALGEAVAATKLAPKDGKAWAKKLKQRHDSGERLNPNQIRCYENALGTPLSEPERDHIGWDGVMGPEPSARASAGAFDEAWAP